MCLGIPGRIVEIRDLSEHRAFVDVEGVRREVNIGLLVGTEGGMAVDSIGVGDWVLVHVGFAMAKIDEEEAQHTLDLVRQFDELFDDELAQFAESDPA